MHSENAIREAWREFGNTPLYDDLGIENPDRDLIETIDEDFICILDGHTYKFEKGTDRYYIWHWFDELNPNVTVAHLMNLIVNSNER